MYLLQSFLHQKWKFISTWHYCDSLENRVSLVDDVDCVDVALHNPRVRHNDSAATQDWGLSKVEA